MSVMSASISFLCHQTIITHCSSNMNSEKANLLYWIMFQSEHGYLTDPVGMGSCFSEAGVEMLKSDMYLCYYHNV